MTNPIISKGEIILSTLYELLQVKENATQEEITEMYHKILQKADSLPQNEAIIEQVRRIKIAYGILSDSEKRKKYDSDLATKRAEELLENVQIKEEKEPESSVEPNKEERLKEIISNQINTITDTYQEQKIKQEQQKKLAEKQAKKEFRRAKREAKKQQQIKREMQIQAYGDYLQKQGYKVKYPWTWLRVKRLLIAIFVVIFTLFILWHIPFIKNSLTNLYQENIVIKYLVDILNSIFTSILDGIKSNFQ